IGNRAGVRVRKANGSVEELILEGRSPFEWSVMGVVVRLRWLTFYEAMGRVGDLVDGSKVAVFLQSDRPLSLSEVGDVIGTIRDSANAPFISATVENGWFFADASDYPIYNRFLPYTPTPAMSDLKRLTRFSCGVSRIDKEECDQIGPSNK